MAITGSDFGVVVTKGEIGEWRYYSVVRSPIWSLLCFAAYGLVVSLVNTNFFLKRLLLLGRLPSALRKVSGWFDVGLAQTANPPGIPLGDERSPSVLLFERFVSALVKVSGWFEVGFKGLKEGDGPVLGPGDRRRPSSLLVEFELGLNSKRGWVLFWFWLNWIVLFRSECPLLCVLKVWCI
jgi:hypothetical protein